MVPTITHTQLGTQHTHTTLMLMVLSVPLLPQRGSFGQNDATRTQRARRRRLVRVCRVWHDDGDVDDDNDM